jgi:hypothetical protein
MEPPTATRPVTDVNDVELEDIPTGDSDAKSLAETVNRQFTCFDVTYSWQRAAGQRQIKGAEVRLGDNALGTDKASKPTSKLMPDAWREKFQAIETEKGRLVRAHTLPGMAGGTACVRTSKALEFARKLLKLREQLHTLRAELSEAWDVDVVAWNAERWGDDWERVKRHLPNKEQLANIIDLTWSQFQVMPAELDFQLTNMGSEELDELLSTTRQMTNDRVEGFVSAIFEAPRERLVKAVEGVVESLRGGRKITDATFNRMREAVQFLREMTDMPGLADTELLDQIAAAETIVRNVPRQIGSRGTALESYQINAASAVSNGLVGSLESIIERAADADVVQTQLTKFGRMGRGLDIGS